MRPRRLLTAAILIIMIWLILTLAPLIKPGFLPYFFEPEQSQITINADSRQIEIKNGDLIVEIQKFEMTIQMRSNVSIEAICPLTVKSLEGSILNLSSGESEVLSYMASEKIRLSAAKLLARNATISVSRKNEVSSVIVTDSDSIEIEANYNKTQDNMPVWLSDGAAIRIASSGSEFGWSYVIPQDLLVSQALLKMGFPIGESKKSRIEFIYEAMGANATFRQLLVNATQGRIDIGSMLSLEAGNAFQIRSDNPKGTVSLRTNKSDSDFRITAQDVKGLLWVDGIPQPESRFEQLLRSAIAAFLSVAVIVLTIALDKHLTTQKNVSSEEKTSSQGDMELLYIEGLQAYLFFPEGTGRDEMNLSYHKKHLRQRLIVNLKTTPPKAYFITPNSYGWRFIEKYPDRWISEIVPLGKFNEEDDKFAKSWCKKKGYDLKPWVAEKKDLQEG